VNVASKEGAVVAQGRVRSVAVGVSGLVATVSAAVGLWVTLFSGGGTQTAATPVGGSLLERDLLDQVTLGRYLRENGMPAGKYTSAQRSLQGAEALLQVRLTGLTGRPSLFWTLFHLAPRTPLGGSFDHQNGGEVPALSGTFEGIAKVWLPLPNKPGVYRARIELEYKGATLDFVDSRRIGVIQPFTPPVVGGSEHLNEPAPAPPVPIPHAAAVFTAVPPSPH
jgi:hypothetical protein